MGNESRIGRVFLKFGAACNFRCRHCIQEPSAESKAEPVVSEKVYKYIERLASARPPERGRLNVMLWGGEPLMYWNAIKAVVERLGDAVGYSMTSNGALLTDDKVEYMNERGIHYTLSNDGAQTARVRGVNVLEDEAVRRRFLRLNSRAIDAVIHAYNQDYQALIGYVQRKAPGTHLFTEPLSCTWDMPEDIYAFDAGKYRASLRKMCEQAKADLIAGKRSFAEALAAASARRVMDKIYEECQGVFLPADPWPACGQVRNVMNLDCAGNVYACHNIDEKIGTIDDDYDTLVERYDAKWKLPKECERCPAAYFCRGGCPYAQGQKGREKTCEMERIRHEEILRFVASFADVAKEIRNDCQ